METTIQKLQGVFIAGINGEQLEVTDFKAALQQAKECV